MFLKSRFPLSLTFLPLVLSQTSLTALSKSRIALIMQQRQAAE